MTFTRSRLSHAVIDGLLDTATFIYIGTIIPWSEFSNEYLTPWKLVLFAICILLFRRLPAMMAVYKIIPALEGWREGVFAGWCVAAESAVQLACADRVKLTQVRSYRCLGALYVAKQLRALLALTELSHADYAILALHVLPEDRIVLRSVIFPVVIFMAMGSTIVHVRAASCLLRLSATTDPFERRASLFRLRRASRWP